MWCQKPEAGDNIVIPTQKPEGEKTASQEGSYKPLKLSFSNALSPAKLYLLKAL